MNDVEATGVAIGVFIPMYRTNALWMRNGSVRMEARERNQPGNTNKGGI
jgi:hypothetical protein